MEALKKSKRLLLRSKPKSDESFIGYILRLTELNDYDSSTWIIREARIGYHRDRCIATTHKPPDFSALAALAGVNIADIESLRYFVDRQSNAINRRLLFGLTVPQYVIRPNCQKVCPKCLVQSAYIRRIWEFALVTVCPIHKCLLLDECPKCRRRISWSRNRVAVCSCNYDWREYHPPMVASSDMYVTQQIHLLCHLATGGGYMREDGTNGSNPFYRVDLHNLVAALLFVASQFARTDYKKGRRLIDTTGKNFARTKQNSEIHILLCKAWAVFNNWPENYFDFLEWRRVNIPNRRFRAGVDRDFAEYKSALYYQLASEQLNFMREGFEEYLITRWAGGYVAHVRRLSPSLRMRSKYVSRTDAKAFLHINVEAIDRLIALGKLNAVIRNNGSSRGILIERASLDIVKQELEHSLNLKQVAEMLGIASQRVHELIECNLLRPLTNEGINGRGDRKFSSEEIKCLVAGVRSKHVKSHRIAVSDNISFLKAVRILGRVHISIGQFIQTVLDGMLRPVGLSARVGLNSLVFSRSDIKSYIRNLEQSMLGETFSVPEVARRLGIGLNNIRFLINKGIIPIRRQAIKGHHDLRIAKNSIDLFNSTYILPAKLTHRFNTTSSRLTNVLIMRGVTPVSGPKIDGGKQYVFNRAEIEKIDLEAMWRASEGEHINRLNERKLFDAQHAAEILNIDPCEVLDLAERGILLPHRHIPSTRHKTNGPFFSLFTLEQYSARTIDFSGLVSATVAARMLGVSVSNLYRYIPKKLLHVAVDYDQAGRRYFRLDEVKGLVERRSELSQQCITTAGVASICKVSNHSVHSWVEAGLLQTISVGRADGLVHKLYLRSDVENLYAAREAYKADRVSQGRSARFGRPPGPSWRPVRSKVEPRIRQLVKKWSENGKPVSGQRLRRQLVKEGYRVGINTIYICLRELRRQVGFH